MSVSFGPIQCIYFLFLHLHVIANELYASVSLSHSDRGDSFDWEEQHTKK